VYLCRFASTGTEKRVVFSYILHFAANLLNYYYLCSQEDKDMKLKAHINELGPVKDLDIELNQMVLLTGASGLGKSYTAFVLQYMSGIFGSVLSSESLGYRLQPFIKQQMQKEGKEGLFETLDKAKNKIQKADADWIGKGEENKTLLFHFSLNDLFDWMKRDVQNYISYLVGYEDFRCDVDFFSEVDEHK
jgi:hypothetical protein